MASPTSVISGSPEAQTPRIETPVNGYESFSAPSRFLLTPSQATEDSWGAMGSSHLFESKNWKAGSLYSSTESLGNDLSGFPSPSPRRLHDRETPRYSPSAIAPPSMFCLRQAESTTSASSLSAGTSYDQQNKLEDLVGLNGNTSDLCASSTLGIIQSQTRHILVTILPPQTPIIIVRERLERFGDLQNFYSHETGPKLVCLASYYDILQASEAFKWIQTEEKNWLIKFCTSADVERISGFRIQNEGQVCCEVLSGGNSSTVDRVLYQTLSDYGVVSSFGRVDGTRPAFIVSYYDTRKASEVVSSLNGHYFEGLHLRVTLQAPSKPAWNSSDLLASSQLPSHLDQLSISNPRYIRQTYDSGRGRRGSTGSLKGFNRYSPLEQESAMEYYGTRRDHYMPSFNYYPDSRPSSLVRAPPSPWDPVRDYGPFPDPSFNRGHDYRSSNYPHYTYGSMALSISRRLDHYNPPPLPNKNTVDLDRIARGLDTRTTVMLRNIPNKVDQQTLKDYVDSTSRGLYNFLYLRIDFKNMCNVGYAFINFIDPLDIITFVKEKAGTRWNKYNSDKVLDVTYANIQGIDQLVEKFRNSSVMDQPPAYRPKLFHSSGPLAGVEMDFPPPNNLNRKLRSITAAQHIGLFAPKLSSNKNVWRRRD